MVMFITLFAVSVVLLQMTLPFVGVLYVVIFNVKYYLYGFLFSVSLFKGQTNLTLTWHTPNRVNIK